MIDDLSVAINKITIAIHLMQMILHTLTILIIVDVVRGEVVVVVDLVKVAAPGTVIDHVIVIFSKVYKPVVSSVFLNKQVRLYSFDR